MNNWTVYMHVCPNNKIYVGITGRKPEERWGINGQKYLNKRDGKFVQTLFANCIIKYGWNNIKHVILEENLSKEEAIIREKALIKLYKNKKLSLNITDGGEGTLGIHFHHTEASKEKITKHHRKKQTLETIAKIKKTMTGQKYSEERKQHCREGHRHEMLCVLQYDLKGNFLAEYESIMTAAKIVGIPSSNISRCCKGRYHTAGGYIWKYKNKIN